jgi:hypothetical protein
LCIVDEKRSGEDLAIEVRGGYKSFGCGSRRVHVMKNFNMSVPRGNIYGLLGKLLFRPELPAVGFSSGEIV